MARRTRRKTHARPTPPRQSLALEPLEREFVALYQANGGNATQAYLGIHPHARYGTARVEGCRLLAKPNVRTAVDRERLARWKRIQMEAGEALELLAARARGNIGELFNEKGELLAVHLWPKWMLVCVKSYKPDPDGGPAYVVLHDGLRALELVLTIEGKLRNKLDVAHSFDLEAYLAAKTPA